MTELSTAPPHASAIAEVERVVAGNVLLGLDEAEAVQRLARDGPNRLDRPERPPFGELVLRQLADPLVVLLLAACAVSAAIGETLEAGAIVSIVVLNAALGFGQEVRAHRAVLALRDSFRHSARVVREGRVIEVPAEEVVVGDLLDLREGDAIAADARVVESVAVEVDESALTGESVPVPKSPDRVTDASALGDRASMVHAAASVVRGHGRAVVVATGAATEVGRIALLAQRARRPKTPLQRRTSKLAQRLALVGAALTVALGVGMLLRGADADEAFLFAVSVAVAAVPEGLAATVTVALALGARSMAARGAIVSRLAAVETLGETTVICSDKTGTLTENRLTLAATLPAEGVTDERLLERALLASSTDTLDVALAEGAARRGVTRAAATRGVSLVEEIPFDPLARRTTMVYDGVGGRLVVSKGAPEVLLPADDPLQEAARRWAEEGLRVLAVVAVEPARTLGLLAFHDPLRPGVARSVEIAQRAGVRVKMVTGDHPATARAIGQTLGLDDADVHARVAPAEKLDLVAELQTRRDVVTVTGDGVNDAPALRKADVGVAMGLSGTEVARESADVVLTDDDFSTIVAAVREGRRILANVRTFTTFLLSANFGEVVLFAVAVAAGLGAPMTVVQILTINLLTDGLPAVALSREPARPETMDEHPRPGGELLGGREWASLFAIGSLVGAAALVAYAVGDGRSDQTMAFATIGAAELVLVFTLRSAVRPAWRGGRNPYLWTSVVASLGVLLVAVYLPALRGVFGTVPLDPRELAIVGGCAIAPAAVVELAKGWRRWSSTAA